MPTQQSPFLKRSSCSQSFVRPYVSVMLVWVVTICAPKLILPYAVHATQEKEIYLASSGDKNKKQNNPSSVSRQAKYVGGALLGAAALVLNKKRSQQDQSPNPSEEEVPLLTQHDISNTDQELPIEEQEKLPLATTALLLRKKSNQHDISNTDQELTIEEQEKLSLATTALLLRKKSNQHDISNTDQELTTEEQEKLPLATTALLLRKKSNQHDISNTDQELTTEEQKKFRKSQQVVLGKHAFEENDYQQGIKAFNEKKFNTACKKFENALNQLGDTTSEDLAEIHAKLGISYANKKYFKKYDKALKHLEKAKEIYENKKPTDITLRGDLAYFMGNIYYKTKNYEKAARLLQEANDLYEAKESKASPEDRANVAAFLALNLELNATPKEINSYTQAQKQYKKAIKLCNDAIDFYKTVNKNSLTMEAQEVLKGCEETLKGCKAGLERVKKQLDKSNNIAEV